MLKLILIWWLVIGILPFFPQSDARKSVFGFFVRTALKIKDLKEGVLRFTLMCFFIFAMWPVTVAMTVKKISK